MVARTERCERRIAMEVVREVVFDAPPDQVWDALTDPERLEEWFANDVEFDLDRGGVFRWEDGEVRHAVVEEVEPERRLAIRWWNPSAPEESEVTFTLDETEEGTRLVVTETATTEWAWALEAYAYAGRQRLLCAV
jgi:uncharacterized protein YndB with AHSA1/START domain